jgi:hypothetical protein
MHLHRSENKYRDGIFQAIGYSEKPNYQVKRLRSGAYFVSVEVSHFVIFNLLLTFLPVM